MINKRMFDNSKEKKYCTDVSLIENYNEAVLDKTAMWECHHKLEAFFTVQELIHMGRYYNVKPRELIFLKRKDHYNWPHKGRIIKEETKSKMSESHKGKSSGAKGKTPWNKDKSGVQKVSNNTKNMLSEIQKGRHWYTNGIICVKTYVCPEGFTPGRIRNW